MKKAKEDEPRVTKKTHRKIALLSLFQENSHSKKDIVEMKVHCYFPKPSLVDCRYFHQLKAVAKGLFILTETGFQRPFEKVLLDS